MGRTSVPKRKKDENKPKRPTSAYFYFMAQQREDAKAKGQSISRVAEWTKEVSGVWRELSTKERKVFDDKAVIDKERYAKAMAIYKGTDLNEGKPKRPQTSYFLWLATFRVENKDKFADHKDLLREAGKSWKKLTHSQRTPYDKMASDEKHKYIIAMKEFNAKKGGDSKKMKMTKNGKSAAVVEEDEDNDDEEDEEDAPKASASAKNGADDDEGEEDESEEEESE